MPTALDMPAAPCQLLPETEPTTLGTMRYEGFWASSGTLENIVEVDRIAANPINRTDPTGKFIWFIIIPIVIGGTLFLGGCSPQVDTFPLMDATTLKNAVDVLRPYMAGNPTVRACVNNIESGELRIGVFEPDKKNVGLYQAGDKPYEAIGVSKEAIGKGSTATALTIYAEFIHTKLTGSPHLEDGQAAQDVLNELRDPVLQNLPAGDEHDWIRDHMNYPGAQ
jgi:hypothetical protein